MRKRLFTVIAVVAIAGQFLAAQTAHKSKKPTAKSDTTSSAWTPDVQQYLGVQQGSFGLVGLNKLSKAQLDSLVNVAKSNVSGDSKRYLLNCTPATPGPAGKVRVLVTVSGDDPQGLRLAEIRQAIRGLSGVDVVDAPANADRALHVVIQEQTLSKRIIGYTASYMTATPCRDVSRKADMELKGQLGTYTDPNGADLARDLAGMLDQDLKTAHVGR